MVNVVMGRTGVARPDAEQRVDGWIKSYQDARARFDQQKLRRKLRRVRWLTLRLVFRRKPHWAPLRRWCWALSPLPSVA